MTIEELKAEVTDLKQQLELKDSALSEFRKQNYNLESERAGLNQEIEFLRDTISTFNTLIAEK